MPGQLPTPSCPHPSLPLWAPAATCSAPYWFHLVRYTTRMHAVALLMAASYTIGGSVGPLMAGGWLHCQSALGLLHCNLSMLPKWQARMPRLVWLEQTRLISVLPAPFTMPGVCFAQGAPPPPPSAPAVALSTSRGWQLLGVVFASLQGGLGEASCLAMTSHYRRVGRGQGGCRAASSWKWLYLHTCQAVLGARGPVLHCRICHAHPPHCCGPHMCVCKTPPGPVAPPVPQRAPGHHDVEQRHRVCGRGRLRMGSVAAPLWYDRPLAWCLGCLGLCYCLPDRKEICDTDTASVGALCAPGRDPPPPPPALLPIALAMQHMQGGQAAQQVHS